MIATIRPIRSRLVGTAAVIQPRLDLRRHLLRLAHHVMELGEHRVEFVIIEGHDPILRAAVLRN
jgi:hypothetical protein